jgi:hypothetical protein
LYEIPFAEAYRSKSVDVKHKQVRMNLPEGLLEVNAPLTAEEKQEQQQGTAKKEAGKHVGKNLCATPVSPELRTGFRDEGRYCHDFSGLLSWAAGLRHHPPGPGNGPGEIEVHDLREFTHDRHRTVDDRPFGGGEGMVLKPEPLFECLESMGVAPRAERAGGASEAIGNSALGAGATVYAEGRGGIGALDRIVFICGRYEGVDERVADFLADRELSIGDYVLSGGEMAAAVIVEAVMRLLPGAVGNEASTQQESFTVDVKGKAWTARIRLAGRMGCSIIRTTRGQRNFVE